MYSTFLQAVWNHPFENPTVGRWPANSYFREERETLPLLCPEKPPQTLRNDPLSLLADKNSPFTAHPGPNPQPILKCNLSTLDPISLISFSLSSHSLLYPSRKWLWLFQLLILIIFFILCVSPTTSFIFSVRKKKFKHIALETMNIFLSINCK